MARRKLLTKNSFSDFVILIARGHAEIENIFNLTDSEIINFKNKLSGDVITDYEILLNKSIVFDALNNAKSSRYDLKSSIDEISDISFYDLKYKAESLGMIYIDESKNEKKRLRKKEQTKVKIWMAVFILLPILFLTSFCSMRGDVYGDREQKIREICVNAQFTGKSMDGSVDECVERITGA